MLGLLCVVKNWVTDCIRGRKNMEQLRVRKKSLEAETGRNVLRGK